MPEMIVGSPSQNLLMVTESGAIPICGYSGTQLYTLRTDSTGKLETTTTATVTTGSEQYIYGKSGTSWWPLLVESGTGKLITSASVTVDRVYLASGADIGSVYLKDGAYVKVIPSGTFYSSISVSGTALPISGIVGVEFSSDYVNVIQSGTSWDILGSTHITNPIIQVSGNITISDNSYVYVRPSGVFYTTGSVNQAVSPWIVLGSQQITNATLQISGPIKVTDDSFIKIIPSGTFYTTGSFNLVNGAFITGSTQITNTTMQVSGPVKITDDSFIKIIPSGTFYSTIAGSGTTGLPISGVVTVTNLATAGSLATQGIIGSIQLTTTYFPGSVWQGTSPWIILGSSQITNSTIQVSGNVTMSNDNYVYVRPSGTFYTTGSINLQNGAYVSVIASGTTGLPISGVVYIKKPYTFVTGSIPVVSSSGTKTVSMYGECGLISLAGSNVNAGSTYKFGMYDADGYLILSQLSRTGSMAYLTPFPVSGNNVLNITEAQSDSNYNFKVAYI